MAVSEKIELLLREERSKEVERDSVADEFRCATVDILDAHERELLVSGLRRLDFSCHCITCLQRMLLDLILGYIDVVRGVEIVVV